MDLLFMLSQASHALANQMAAKLAEVDLTPRQYCVLTTAQGEELTQIRLAERSALDKTTMVVTLDELERRGMAERRPSSSDRRARIVAVTDAGVRATERASAIVDELYEDVLATLAPEQREAALAALRALVAGPLAAPSHVERPVRRPRAQLVS